MTCQSCESENVLTRTRLHVTGDIIFIPHIEEKKSLEQSCALVGEINDIITKVS